MSALCNSAGPAQLYLREVGATSSWTCFPEARGLVVKCNQSMKHLKKLWSHSTRSTNSHTHHVFDGIAERVVSASNFSIASITRSIRNLVVKYNQSMKHLKKLWSHSTCSTNSDTHQVFDGITERVVSASDFSIASIIRSISNLGCNDRNRGIHAVAVKLGYEVEAPVVTALVGFYSSIHELGSAERVFNSVPTKDVVLWTSLVSAFCKNGMFAEGIDTFRSMIECNVSPNSVSLLSVLTACANTRALTFGKQIHGFAVVQGYHSEASLQNSILDMYLKCGELDVSMLVFDGIGKKDTISWKNMILGLMASGQATKALLLFSHMRSSKVETNEIILRNVISVCSQVRDFKFGLGLHCFVIKNGLSFSTFIGTSLLKMYAEFMEVETAQTLFDQLSYKDHIAWSAMISVYSQSSTPILALELFKQMQSVRKEANEMTFVSLLRTCSSMEAQELGRSIHARILRLRYDSNMYVNSALVDFYCKIGRLGQGEILFDNLQNRDIVCWSSMINGYGINGHGEEAVKTFNIMLEHGLMPNEVVFVSLLSACAHCGLLDEGWKWFYSMEGKFGIPPTLTHYTCIIDLLGRLGCLGRALEFIRRMPMEPDTFIWGALLSWCRTKHEDVKIAEIAVEELMRLDPNNSSYYVTLANIYSKLGHWEDAERIRMLMEENGLRKIVGYSMV